MKNLSKNKEALELSKQFIAQGFSQLKKDNPKYYESLQPVMYSKNVPSFILKYFQRKKDRIELEISLEEVMKKTWLNKGQINYLFNKGKTLSDMLNMK